MIEIEGIIPLCSSGIRVIEFRSHLRFYYTGYPMFEKNLLTPQGDKRRGQTAEPRRQWITPTVSTIDLRAAEAYGGDDTKDSGASAT